MMHRPWILAVAYATLTAACATETRTDVGDSGKGGNGNDLAQEPNDTLVGIAIRVKNPDGKNIYLGVYDSVPQTTLDVSTMVEFGDNDVTFYNGYAYVWDRDASTYTRWEADAQGQLSAGPVFSLQNKGVSGKQMMQAVSATRAYSYGSFDAGSSSITVWDPTAMQWTGSLDAAAVANPNAQLYDDNVVSAPALFDHYVAFAFSWENQDSLLLDPRATVALVDTATNAAVLVASDTRCAGASGVFVDAAGDLYVTADNAGGLYNLYTNNPAPLPAPCVLRIKKGSTAFDPTYQVDLAAATGAPAINASFYAGDRKLLVQALANASSLTKSADYGKSGKFNAMLVDVTSQAAAMQVGALTALSPSNSLQHHLGGQLFFQVYSSKTSVDMYQIGTDASATKTFTVPGDMWALGGMRPH